MQTTETRNNTGKPSRRGFLAGMMLIPALAVPAAVYAHKHPDEHLISLAARAAALSAKPYEDGRMAEAQELARDAAAIPAATPEGVAAKMAIAGFQCQDGPTVYTLGSGPEERLLRSALADKAVYWGGRA